MIESNSDNQIILNPFVSQDILCDGEPERKGIAIAWDFEANGLLPYNATQAQIDAVEPFEVGMVIFEYCKNTGQPYKIIGRVSCFEDISNELLPDVIKVTNITKDMITGHKFDDDLINSYIAMADLHIAHNARYDARIALNRFPSLKGKAWACTLNEIDWLEYADISGRSQAFIMAFMCGMHYVGHRALTDAEALTHILSHCENGGEPVMRALIMSARQSQVDVYAVGASFDVKDELSANGYRWFPGGMIGEQCVPKAWHKVVSMDDVNKEIEWLKDGITTRDPVQVVINAVNRYTQ